MELDGLKKRLVWRAFRHKCSLWVIIHAITPVGIKQSWSYAEGTRAMVVRSKRRRVASGEGQRLSVLYHSTVLHLDYNLTPKHLCFYYHAL
jgi:hypothetical protein